MSLEPYAASFARFVELTGGDGKPLPDVATRPTPFDEVLGPSLFRTYVEDCSVTRLNLPGLFIGRSELSRVNFSGSHFRLSNFAWNDFAYCCFAECDLQNSDLRASRYERCDFSRASLIDCDLRHASFENCLFTGADFTHAILPDRLRTRLALTEAQLHQATWTRKMGPSPTGDEQDLLRQPNMELQPTNTGVRASPPSGVRGFIPVRWAERVLDAPPYIRGIYATSQIRGPDTRIPWTGRARMSGQSGRAVVRASAVLHPNGNERLGVSLAGL